VRLIDWLGSRYRDAGTGLLVAIPLTGALLLPGSNMRKDVAARFLLICCLSGLVLFVIMYLYGFGDSVVTGT